MRSFCSGMMRANTFTVLARCGKFGMTEIFNRITGQHLGSVEPRLSARWLRAVAG